MIRVKAIDSFNISGYPTVHAKEEIELPELVAADLEKVGLVKIIGAGKKDTAEASGKAIVPTTNKMMDTTGMETKTVATQPPNILTAAQKEAAKTNTDQKNEPPKKPEKPKTVKQKAPKAKKVKAK